jgi:hypothetical protein
MFERIIYSSIFLIKKFVNDFLLDITKKNSM